MHGPLPLPATLSVVRTRPRDALIAAFVLTLIAIVARAQTFGNPIIGYDEQFYLLVGDRMWQGAMPYVDIFDRKPIGLFLIYAAMRLLPVDPFIAYKIGAVAFAMAGGLGVYLLARRATGHFGALVAGSLCIIWYSYMGGEGGQSPIFYNPFMIAGAGFVMAAIDRPARARALGMGAMLCAGLAIQIKYCAVFEGIYFGCALIWIALQAGERLTHVAGSALLWIGAALAPTFAVLAVYAATGHAWVFIFDNFLSPFGQGRNPVDTSLIELAEIFAILSPLLVVLAYGVWKGMAGVAAGMGPIGAATAPARERFVQGWFFAAVIGMLLFWRFNSPHYGLPVLLPLTLWMAPIFDTKPRRPWVSIALVGMALVVAQMVLRNQEMRHGGPTEAQLVTQEATPDQKGCIFVYSGYPALYMLTHSCLPSRWPFPGSLNMRDERKVEALGVDAAQEVKRIMAAKPPVVVDEYPRSRHGNDGARAQVDRGLIRDYALSGCTTAGIHRVSLVYKLRAPGTPPPADLQGEAARCAGLARAEGGIQRPDGGAVRVAANLRAPASASVSTD